VTRTGERPRHHDPYKATPRTQDIDQFSTARVHQGVGNQEGRLTAGAFTGRGFSEENFAVVDKVVEFAQARGVSPSQVALAWLRSRGDNIIPILGARTAAQLKDNLGCLTLELSAEELATLTALKPCDLGFPGDFYTSQGIERLLFGETRDLIEAPRPVI